MTSHVDQIISDWLRVSTASVFYKATCSVILKVFKFPGEKIKTNVLD